MLIHNKFGNAKRSIFCSFPGNLNIQNCDAAFIAVGLGGGLATMLNSLLMFFRVRAVYHGSKVMVAFFSFLWLATAAASLLGPFTLKGVHIGPTQICTTSEVASFGSATFIAAGVHDTIIFLAITYRMVIYHVDAPTRNWTHRLKIMVSGEGMGNISRLLLRTGVFYYLYVFLSHLWSAVHQLILCCIAERP